MFVFCHSFVRVGYRKILSISLSCYILISVFLLSGCSFFISSATVDMTENLSQAILNNNDLATVEAGGPAYLLMVDSLLYRNPDNGSLLREAANIYTAYTTVFVQDKARAKKLTEKALSYALRAVCIRRSKTCRFREANFQEFKNTLLALEKRDVPDLFALGSAWSAWIQIHRGDWNAVAEISRVEAIMKRVIELDEFYQDGGAHLYLGVLTTFLPPALGGKPDVGRRHFERALEISRDKNLMVKVMYAQHYARLMFDQKLHDRLLNEVLEAEADVPGYTLGNTLAQQRARELIKSGKDYF
ncbi:MAG: TRAP transporter TatT component family protein [Deltaproteobacteria bacterium]|nr:TRAP transporter TatT component family protein [Deltaproteobacteria bacterium]